MRHPARPSDEKDRAQLARRAFISAPLIGTVLFLTAVFFSVNLAKVDNAQVTQIASDAYHNRLVSVLETYRTDLKSIFTTSLTRSVEGVLTSQCWQTGPFSIRNPNEYAFASKEYVGVAGALPNSENTEARPPLFEEKIERYSRCRELSKLVSSNVCSASTGFGLKGWLSNLQDTISFEGLNLQPLDAKIPGTTTTYFQDFLDTINNRDCSLLVKETSESDSDFQARQNDCLYGVTRKPTLCNRMIGENHLFDCTAFAERAETPSTPLRCCTKEFFDRPENKIVDANGMIPSCTAAADIVPGCEDGTFFMNIHVTDPVLFPRMPRIQASDGRGNSIRSGAVADGDLAVHIGFPLFYYYDAAFTMYRPLAYGNPGTLQKTDPIMGKYACQGAKEGIVEGACVGSPATCANAYQSSPGDPTTDRINRFLLEARTRYNKGSGAFASACQSGTNFPDTDAGQQAAKAALAGNYAANVLLPSVALIEGLDTVYRPPSTVGTALCGNPGSSTVPRLCPQVYKTRSGGVTQFYKNEVGSVADQNSLTYLMSTFATPNHEDGSPAGWAAYFDSLSLEIHLKDQSPVYQVDPGAPNDYCFQARPYLYQTT